jgi:hypothetical protein
MKTEFYVSYGCYINMEAEKVIVTYPDFWDFNKVEAALIDEYHSRAIDVGDSYYGLHGFEIDLWEEEEEDEQANAIADFLEDQAEVIVEVWDEDAHAGSVQSEVTEIDYTE